MPTPSGVPSEMSRCSCQVRLTRRHGAQPPEEEKRSLFRALQGGAERSSALQTTLSGAVGTTPQRARGDVERCRS